MHKFLPTSYHKLFYFLITAAYYIFPYYPLHSICFITVPHLPTILPYYVHSFKLNSTSLILYYRLSTYHRFINICLKASLTPVVLNPIPLPLFQSRRCRICNRRRLAASSAPPGGTPVLCSYTGSSISITYSTHFPSFHPDQFWSSRSKHTYTTY